ncbi:MAG: clan AA aspartic protease [Planctomycetaceae bacterium]
MMTGVVTDQFEAVVTLTVLGSGQTESCDAVIDTGFTDWLTLPPSMVNDLELRRISSGKVALADGSSRIFEIYQADILWSGRKQRVQIYECDTTPLIGMRLMKGCRLTMDIETQDKVEIVPLEHSSP